MLKWDTYEVDDAALPGTVVSRLLNSAFAHIMANEASAHVVGQIRGVIAGKDGKRNEVSTEQVRAWRANEHNAAQIAEWEDSFRKAKVAAMLDGTLAVKVARAPTRDPVEAIMRQIAKLEVSGVLEANGVKFPKKDSTITLPGGEEVDGDTLIDRRLAHAEHGPRIKTAAERKHRDDMRLRENAAKAASGTLADLAA